MGIKHEWDQLLQRCPAIMTIEPTDTTHGRAYACILSDQTASARAMDFSGNERVFTTGDIFADRIIKKFILENMNYAGYSGLPKTFILLWDKPWNTPRRAEMYTDKRYRLPDPSTPVPYGKVRGCDGRFYAPTKAPLPKFDPATGYGLKPELAITSAKMYPLSQLLAASWTKTLVAQFICQTLWQFASQRDEHFIFDTPFIQDDPLCDGHIHCNQPDCTSCPFLNLPRHGEADLLFLYHIQTILPSLPPDANLLVRGTNDRDLLAILTFPFQPNYASRITWCKGTGTYAMAPSATWEVPSSLTGKPTNCYEYINMIQIYNLFNRNSLLLTRLYLLFFFGADYCSTPNGLTTKGLNYALYDHTLPIIYEKNDQLGIDLNALRLFIHTAHSRSTRCKTTLNANNLLKTSLDALYSLAYYTGFFLAPDKKSIGEPVGPSLSVFGYTPVYTENEIWLSLFQTVLLPPALATLETNILYFSLDSSRANYASCQNPLSSSSEDF